MAGGRRKQVEQDLETHARNAGTHAAQEGLVGDHEESAHRVAQVGLQHQLRQPCRGAAHRGARSVLALDATAVDIAAAEDDIDFGLVHEDAQHGRQLGFVVLQIGVHHCNDRRDCGRAVGRIVIDVDQFPIDIRN
jgi:hypothetical protein